MENSNKDFELEIRHEAYKVSGRIMSLEKALLLLEALEKKGKI